MNDSWHANPAVWGYGAAAMAFAWLVVRLVAQWRPGGKPAMLLAVAVTTATAAATSVTFIAWPLLGVGWLAALADFLRVAASLGFLLVLLGVRSSEESERTGKGWTPMLGAGIALLLAWLLLGVKPPGVVDPYPLTRLLGFVTALGVAVFGLMLVEQCYRRTPSGSRWNIRPLFLGLAGIFAFDVVLYSDALLFRAMDFDLWAARGFAQALAVPLIHTTLRRRRGDWSFQLSVSRGVVAGSTALALTGAYLLLVAGAGYLLRQFGGSWARALESVLVFAAVLLMAVIGLSGTFRAKVRVLVAKHFFTYRYDYREEWLRLTNTLISGPAERPWSSCIHALGNLVESPGGALWFRNTSRTYRQVERFSFPAMSEELPEESSLPAYLKKTGWVLDVHDVVEHPSSYEDLQLPAEIAGARDAWLIVPLITAEDLVGFVVLSAPRVKVQLDWEVLDLLKTAGRQAAGYVAYTQATEALLEAQKFDAFHRMSTFVVHDLKNLIAQLQLLLSNAERHRDNPQFQRDMLRTIEHVVGRMHQLTLQLRPEASARDRPQVVEVETIVRRIESLRLGDRSGLLIDAEQGAFVLAHEDLLERVIAHLVQNAFEASDPGQQVKVRVTSSMEEVTIEVSDEGKGMTAEFMRERLFRPFQTTKETGMGIGMYECQQYVQQVGGHIEVKSAPGEGTRVTVRLRAVAPGQVGAAA